MCVTRPHLRFGLVFSAAPLLLMCLVVTVGCNGTDDTGDHSPPPTQQADRTDRTSQSAADKTGDRDAADKGHPAVDAVRHLLAALDDNHPEELWNFLPPGYQRDVNELVRDFARRMDAQMWAALWDNLGKTAKVLKSRKPFVLTAVARSDPQLHDLLQSGSLYDNFALLLAALAGSELSDLDRLKTFDGSKFLAGTGGRLLKQFRATSTGDRADPFHALAHAKVTLIEPGEKSVRIRIVLPGRKPVETTYVSIEGRWIPKNLAEGWQQQLGELRKRLAAQLKPAELASRKGVVVQMGERLGRVLDELLAARNQSEFDTIVRRNNVLASLRGAVGLLQRTGGLIGAPLSGDQPPSTTSGKPPAQHKPTVTKKKGPDTVTVIIGGKLTAKAEESLAGALLDAVDDPDQGLMTPVIFRGDKSRTTLSPVHDIAAFARKIRFGTILRVDRKARTISIAPP